MNEQVSELPAARPDERKTTARMRAAVLTVVQLVAFGWLFAAAAPMLAQGGEAPGDDPALEEKEPPERGFRGLLAVRGAELLASENAERLFTPASVLKLVVTAAALHHLGPDYRIATRIWSPPPDEKGVVRGDLVVEAGGDPTWSSRFYEDDGDFPLRLLAQRVVDAGIRRVEGDLVIDQSGFSGRSLPADWSRLDASYSYGAPVSPLAIEENVAWVRIAPGRSVGAPARVAGPGDLEWVNQTRTVGRERNGEGTVDFQMVWGTPRVYVRGEYPISEPAFSLRVSAPNPTLRAAAALSRHLASRGVEIEGGVRLVSDPSTQGLNLASYVESPPLSEIVQPILGDSNNWLAEMLLRLLAKELVGDGRLRGALEIESAFLSEVVGVAEDSFVLDDASGLSPSNLIAPSTVVALLRFAWAQPWREVYFGSLASGSNGTLSRGWGKPPPLAAKTGTIRQTQALAGVLGPRRTEPIFFALFLNHRTDDRWELRQEIVANLWDWYRK